jgi:hypothetical protein
MNEYLYIHSYCNEFLFIVKVLGRVDYGFLKVNFPFASFIDGTRPDERWSVHHRGLFTPPLFSSLGL